MKKTTNLYLASALLSKGAKLEDIDRTDPKHMVFSFSFQVPQMVDTVIAKVGEETYSILPGTPEDQLDIWEREWVNGALGGNLIKYAEAIQRMKSLIHTK